jgi:hypothetical protein
MDDLPLRRSHGSQLHRTPPFDRLLGFADGYALDLTLAALLVSLRVEFHVLAGMKSREHGNAGQILHGVDGLAPATDENAQVVPSDLGVQLLRGFRNTDLRIKPKLAKNPLKEHPQSAGFVLLGEPRKSFVVLFVFLILRQKELLRLGVVRRAEEVERFSVSATSTTASTAPTPMNPSSGGMMMVTSYWSSANSPGAKSSSARALCTASSTVRPLA